jgi:hypothetical protein
MWSTDGGDAAPRHYPSFILHIVFLAGVASAGRSGRIGKVLDVSIGGTPKVENTSSQE